MNLFAFNLHFYIVRFNRKRSYVLLFVEIKKYDRFSASWLLGIKRKCLRPYILQLDREENTFMPSNESIVWRKWCNMCAFSKAREDFFQQAESLADSSLLFNTKFVYWSNSNIRLDKICTKHLNTIFTRLFKILKICMYVFKPHLQTIQKLLTVICSYLRPQQLMMPYKSLNWRANAK